MRGEPKNSPSQQHLRWRRGNLVEPLHGAPRITLVKAKSPQRTDEHVRLWLDSACGLLPRHYVPSAEQRAALMQVVALAVETKILDRRGASERMRLPMLQRQEPTLATTAPFPVDERALSSVPLPDRPRDRARHVPRSTLSP